VLMVVENDVKQIKIARKTEKNRRSLLRLMTIQKLKRNANNLHEVIVVAMVSKPIEKFYLPSVLKGQQRKTESTSKRFHPVPCPCSGFKHSVKVAFHRDIHSYKIFIESHGSVDFKYHGNRPNSSDNSASISDPVGKGVQEKTFFTRLSDLLKLLFGHVVFDLVHCHDVTFQDLATSRVAAILGDDQEGIVFHFRKGLAHIFGNLNGGLLDPGFVCADGGLESFDVALQKPLDVALLKFLLFHMALVGRGEKVTDRMRIVGFLGLVVVEGWRREREIGLQKRGPGVGHSSSGDNASGH